MKFYFKNHLTSNKDFFSVLIYISQINEKKSYFGRQRKYFLCVLFKYFENQIDNMKINF